jgi:hypothetical protein
MAFTPGDFTPSAIGATIMKEKNIIATPRTSELNRDVIAGQALLLHQDPRIIPTGAGLSCMNAKIYAVRAGSLDSSKKTLTCAVPQGPQAGSEGITLTKEILVDTEYFEIKEEFCANAEVFTDVYAELAVKAKANLEMKLSKALVGMLVANADTPVKSWFKTDGSVNGTKFEVPSVNFKSDLLADLQWIGKYLGLNGSIILNGRNFYNESILELYKSIGCCSNDKILNTNQVFDLYWDSQNIDQVSGANSTFIVDKNAVLFWSSPAYSNLGIETMRSQGEEPADRFHFVDFLPRLQYYANGKMNPIYVDVRAEWSCSLDSQGYPRTTWKFEFALSGALKANLKNGDDMQGILRVDQIEGA